MRTLSDEDEANSAGVSVAVHRHVVAIQRALEIIIAWVREMRPIPDDHHSFVFSSSGIHGVFGNTVFMAGVIAFVFAQLMKVLTHWYQTRKWDLSRLAGSGGMPSSHTALIVGLTTAVGVKDGTDSNIFALCLVVSLIVMYDASNVRHQAGRHASLLNIIITEMPPDHPVQDTLLPGERLRDSLGHTPLQVVCGAVLGLIVGYLWQITWSGGAVTS